MSITPQSNLVDKAEEPPIAPSRHRVFRTNKDHSGSPYISLRSRSRSCPAHSRRSSEQPGSRSREGSNPTMTQGVMPPPTPSSPSSSSESPLKRPTEQSTNPDPVERPLRRPSDDKEEVPFSDIIAAFAVDVSGSTQGKVLKEEIDAIKSLCDGLSRDALTQAEIIPWNHVTQSVIRVSELSILSSSGGTDPNSLNTSKRCKSSFG